MPSETSSTLASARVSLVETWEQLHPVYKVFGCVAFAWMAWRTTPILAAFLHLVVLAVGALFVVCCICAGEETCALLNSYKKQVTDYIDLQKQADRETAQEETAQEPQ